MVCHRRLRRWIAGFLVMVTMGSTNCNIRYRRPVGRRSSSSRHRIRNRIRNIRCRLWWVVRSSIHSP